MDVHIRSVSRTLLTAALSIVLFSADSAAQQNANAFSWPEGKTMALSLSFDDARASQAQGGAALLDKYGVKATFFVVPAQVEELLDAWKLVAANGHEIGNHTLNHPCSGNYPWARQKALEDYNLRAIRKEMENCSEKIEKLLGIQPTVFAYPCGHTYVGRGTQTKSYVPVVAGLFVAARTYRDNISNDPAFCDLAQLTGIDMDEKDFDRILPLLQRARQNGHWLILGGHEMGGSAYQTTKLSMLEDLLEYALDPAHGIWIAPVGTIAEYVREKRN